MRNAINLILIAGCATTLMAREQYTRQFQKTAQLSSGRTFRIENSMGGIRIRAHSQNQVDIIASIRCSADTADQAKDCADRIQIRVDDVGGVSVRTVYPEQHDWGPWRRNISMTVEYNIAIPENAPVEVHNSFGFVAVADVHGPAIITNRNAPVNLTGGRGRQRIENAFGDVEVRGNDGDVSVRNTNSRVNVTDVTGAVDVSNRFADVRIINVGRGVTVNSNNCSIHVENAGAPVSVTGSFAPIRVWDAKADVTVNGQNSELEARGIAGTANLHTTFANIRATRIGRALTIHAQNSTITAENIGESATVETSFGGVDLRSVKGGARATANNSFIRLTDIGGEIYARTSFNGVTIAEAAGPITVEGNNNSVTVSVKRGQRCEPLTLSTSFGPIKLTLPQGAGYNLNARTSFGHIHSDQEMTVGGELSKDAVTGRIGGGGCELRLVGQNSNIDILKGTR